MWEAVRDHLFTGLWLVWGFYWLVLAYGGKAVARKESVISRLAHLVPLFFAGYLLAADRLPGGFLCGRAWPATAASYWAGLALLSLGLGFSMWGRIAIGRNWSATVTVKEDHELVRKGPYRFVRHPIYTGLLLGFIGTAVALAEWRGVLAVAIVFIALWRKLKMEERWMGEVFGEAYADYKREVAALVPFLL